MADTPDAFRMPMADTLDPLRMPMSETLEPLRVPLWGSRLIEASAGTGKTWTIAGLYLRLVLGHGEEGAAFVRPLLPAEILVMTFTVAATRELSDRIRARLVEAARCFRGEQQPAADDPFLQSLLDDHASADARATAAWRLSMAAEAMDDAAVLTIDAWVQRMLREHAFDSGSLFDEELLADENAYVDEAVRDYWRQNVYPLQGDALDAVLAVWPTLQSLGEDVRKLLPHVGASTDASGRELSLAELAQATSVSFAREVARLKAGWAERALEMQAWFDTQLAKKPNPFDARKVQAGRIAGWIACVTAWATGDDVRLTLTDAAWHRFSPAGLLEARKGTGLLDMPGWSAELLNLRSQLDALPDPSHALKRHAAQRVRERITALKLQAGTPGFSDMLERLDAALAGPNGERLRERIVTQFPVALIDEFQDTSPLQFRVFDRVYRIASNDPATALFLIGDPKQSIFAFRGADILSYLAARRATEGRRYRLGTNHRSTSALVGAVNHVFAQAEARAGEGAFLFRDADVPGDAGALPFVAVEARGRSEHLRSSMGDVPSLTVCHDGEVLAKRDMLPRFAERAAEHIVTLLNDARAGFDDSETGFARVRPADFAVLVRDRHEAAAIRSALQKRRVASVYLSESDFVFESPLAADLVRWLEAVAAPLDHRRVRAALATPLIGLSIPELAMLATDDAAYEARVEQLRQLKTVWQRQGVLPMLRQTLHLLELPARWLAREGGERKLTDYLHLAELLQAAVAEVEGEETLIRWLAAQIAAPAAGGDANVVRLESDADLVKVITVFKAKGLEYPIVYLPFACAYRSKGRREMLTVPDGDGHGRGTRRVVFEPTADDVTAAERERLQEDLRLLYVALTRARHALWVGVGAYKGQDKEATAFHRSAFGHLIGGSTPRAGTEIAPLLLAVLGHVPSIDLVEGSEPSVTALVPTATPEPLADAPIYTARFETDWAIGSFSRLVRDLSKNPLTQPALQSVADPALQEELAVAPVEAAAPPGLQAPRHRFPRGALPGNFLHDQLEWLAASRFALATDADLRERLARRCDRLGWGHRTEDVGTWLTEVVTTRLPQVGAALDGLSGALPEMEFWFPSEGLPAARIDAICNRHLLNGRPRPALGDRTLNGMVMGFADLVFEHGGRYWVLDYKSNALGDNDAAYDRDALERGMAEHRYDVQAALYLLALHRLLRSRLGAAYEPERHLGGAVYLFMRGVHGPERGCYVVSPPAAMLQVLDQAFGSAAEVQS